MTTGRHEAIDWSNPIDRGRWFLCETVTPLYYTPVYRDLSEEQRRRYNQLTGMFANELIAFLEREFLSATLAALRRGGDRGLAGPIATALEGFQRDEERHLQQWQRLNRLSDPLRYARTDRVFLSVPPWLAWLARQASRYPHLVPVVLWIQLVQEERSVEISRRAARTGPGRLEPRYAAVYREHLRDEARHVQLDRQLIESIYASRSAAVRWTTALLLERAIGAAFLLPGRSTDRILTALAGEYPDLRPRVGEICRALRALGTNEEYLHMMYSRQTTPVTFRLFDRYPEFQRLRRALPHYVAEPGAARAS